MGLAADEFKLNKVALLAEVVVVSIKLELFGRLLLSNFDFNKFVKLLTLICFRLLR
jgi:hypothetical protein